MVIVWRIRGKINRTVLCQLCTSLHTHEEFLHLTLGEEFLHLTLGEEFLHLTLGEEFLHLTLGLGLLFVQFFRFSILYVFLA